MKHYYLENKNNMQKPKDLYNMGIKYIKNKI